LSAWWNAREAALDRREAEVSRRERACARRELKALGEWRSTAYK
jgi:hypothetical protein